MKKYQFFRVRLVEIGAVQAKQCKRTGHTVCSTIEQVMFKEEQV
jgi:hypothetical protein